MAGLLPADSLQSGSYEGVLYNNQQLEDGTGGGGRWYYSRKEIEENSASRKDGIDLKKETYLRKSYCTFLQDLGMRLKVYVQRFNVYIIVVPHSTCDFCSADVNLHAFVVNWLEHLVRHPVCFTEIVKIEILQTCTSKVHLFKIFFWSLIAK